MAVPSTSRAALTAQQRAVVSVVAIGAIALLAVPAVALVLAFMGAGSVASALSRVTASLFPFLFTERLATVDGIVQRAQVFEHGYFYSLLQWSALVVANIGLVRLGFTTHPVWSAIVLALLAAFASGAVVSLLGLQFAQPRM